MPRSFSIKLHSETQVSGGLGMSGGGSPRHAHNPLCRGHISQKGPSRAVFGCPARDPNRVPSIFSPRAITGLLLILT